MNFCFLWDMSALYLSSYAKQLINHSCRSDPNATGGLPGHHVNESIRCVLTHEIRPNEKSLNLNHRATKEITIVIPMPPRNAEWSIEEQIFFFFSFFSSVP